MEPGIFTDLSNMAYHAETDWVGSSQLRNHLPEHFKPFTGSASADFGSVFHQRFTGEDVPVVAVDAATWTGKAAQEQQAAILASGGLPILTRDIETLDGMERAVRAHSEASALLVDAAGGWEVSAFAEVEGVPSKARFDRLLDTGEVVDVKTTKEGPGSQSISKAVANYGYDLQQDHYEAVAAAAGIEVTGFTFVFVQNTPPYHVTVVELDEDYRRRGAALRDLALQRYLHPTMVPAYPGESGRITVSPPAWARVD